MDTPRAKRGYLIINKIKHPVYEGLNPVGRNKQSTVIISDHTVSHQQSAIVILNDKHYICDLNSCNGTQLEHVKLHPLQMYEIFDKKRLYFGNVKGTYEMIFQDSNSQEINHLSQLNDSVFDIPTQALSAADVTESTVDSRAIGDHAHFESALTVRAEPLVNEVVEPPINEDNVKDSIGESNDKEKPEEFADVHNLPTQIIEPDFALPSCSKTIKNTTSDSMKIEEVPSTSINDLPTQLIEYDSINDMSTQIIDPDHSKIKSAPISQTSDDVLQQVNEELHNLPDRTWDEDFFTKTCASDEAKCPEDKKIESETISILSTKLATLLENKLSSEENKSINSLKTQLNTVENERKELKPIVESSDSEEEIIRCTAQDQSNTVDETVINDTVQGDLQESKSSDEDSNCSADFLKMQPVTQFFDDNQSSTTIQVLILQTSQRNELFDNEIPPNECVQNYNSGSNSNNENRSTIVSRLSSQSPRDNFPCSLKTDLLKRKVRNIITDDKEEGNESSDETDVGTENSQSSTTSLKTHFLSYKVRNVITSDNEGEKKEDETKKNQDLSDETDVDEIKETSNDQTSRRKKLTKKSSLKDNQKSDSDSNDEEHIVKKKISLKNDGVNNEDSSDNTDVEKEKSLQLSTLNDSDLVPSSQNFPSSNLNVEKKSGINKKTFGAGSAHSEESMGCSLNLLLTDPANISQIQDSSEVNTEGNINECSKEKTVEKPSSNNPVSDETVIVENAEDDIFIAATQPISQNNPRLNEKSFVDEPTQKICNRNELNPIEEENVGKGKGMGEDDINDKNLHVFKQPKNVINQEVKSDSIKNVRADCDDDIFLQATQPIYANNTRNATNDKNDEDDIFMQPTQVITGNDKHQEKEKFSAVNMDDEDDIFLQATQPVVQLKNKTIEDKKSDVSEDNDDFLPATQDLGQTSEATTEFKKPKLEMCKFPVIHIRGDIFKSPDKPVDSIEATMQKLFQSQQSQNDIFRPAQKRLEPSIESQLEGLFASQSQLAIRNESRPQNPLANILENLQSQHEIILPTTEKENGRNVKENDLQLQEKRKEEDIAMDKNVEQEKSKAQNKNKNKDCEDQEIKKREKQESTEHDKKDQRDKSKDTHKKSDHKSRSHKRTEKSKHKESKKNCKETVDTKHEKEGTSKKDNKKSNNEEELVKILQASKVEKEKVRRQKDVQKTHDEIKDLKTNENLKEKSCSNSHDKNNSSDDNEPPKKIDPKNLTSVQSRESISTITIVSDKSIDSDINLVPLVEIESLECVNLKKSIKEANGDKNNDEAMKNNQIKGIRKPHSFVDKEVEVEGGSLLKRTQTGSSSPLQISCTKTDTSNNRHDTSDLKNCPMEKEFQLDEKSCSIKRSLRGKSHDSKENQNVQHNTGSDQVDKVEMDKTKKPTKRSHRTQKSSKAPSSKASDGTIGDTSLKSSESSINSFDEPNSPSGDNTDSSHSLILLRRSKRKSNERISKSKLKKHKKEPQLSLIEELPESSERTDISHHPSVEIIDLCDSNENFKQKEKTQLKQKEKTQLRQKEKAPLKVSKSTCEVSQRPSTSTSNKTEDDDQLILIKRPRQKHRRCSSSSEDGFIVKTTYKRSRLDISTDQSSDMSGTTLFNSSFSDSSERGRRKLKPKVVFTMMDNPKLESLIINLGGSVVDTVDASTVLVTITVKRTQKLLSAVGQGKPICSPTWLEESKKAQRFLDPWDYILKDIDAEKKWNFSLEESLRRSRNKKLFKNYTMLVLVNTAFDVLKGAIEACGGKCVTRCPSNYQERENFVIVSNEESKSKYSRFLKHEPKPMIIAAEAIFDAALRQEVNFENHSLI